MNFKSILFLVPCESYGDVLSIVGMIYYLLNYYEEIYIIIETKIDIFEYYSQFFKSNRIKVISNLDNIPIDCHVCNTSTDEWKQVNFKYWDHPNINKEYYFNASNPLYTKLNIPDLDRSEFITLPLQTKQVNHEVYYKLLGLNNSVRMNYFNYSRDLEKETLIKNSILKNHNDYIIINNSLENSYFFGLSKDKCINIHQLSTPNNLLSLIEGAKSIHLIEGSNVNFIYHCQYKNIINLTCPIYFHIWARNREWKSINLDFAWKMMDNPRLDNWIFLFNESDYKCN